PLTPDRDEVNFFLQSWSKLQADRFAAYGPKVDLATFGLDKPAWTMTVTVQPADGDKPPAPITHTLTLGKPVGEQAGAFYAQLDKGPGVAVLGPDKVKELKRTYLDFVDRNLLRFDVAKVTALERKGGEDLEIVKREDGWDLVKPAAARADKDTLARLV